MERDSDEFLLEDGRFVFRDSRNQEMSSLAKANLLPGKN